MGYRQWRERQNARIDAMVARADERADRASARHEQVKADAAAAEAERLAVAQAAELEAMRAEARALGEVHEDLVARAAAVGMGLPKPRRRKRLIEAVGEVLASEGAPAGNKEASPYQLWWGRILVEERCAAKLARGEPLSLVDRAHLRFVRGPS